MGCLADARTGAPTAEGTGADTDWVDTLIAGDCLEVLARIPAGCVDMVLCDLPYGVTRCAWDTPLPLPDLWAHYARIVRPDGAIVLTATQPFASALVMSRPRWFRHDWIWRKSALGNFMHAKHRPLAEHEHVLVFSRRAPRYFPEMEAGVPFRCVAGRKPLIVAQDAGPRRNHLLVVNAGTRYPRTIQSFPFPRSSAERRIPTQKPVDLFAYLIRTYTAPGDLVLDHCIGSGTTAVACVREGRHYIGIDVRAQHIALARVRVQDAAAQPPSALAL